MLFQPLCLNALAGLTVMCALLQYSQGRSTAAICGRADLDTDRPRPYGCYDTKVGALHKIPLPCCPSLSQHHVCGQFCQCCLCSNGALYSPCCTAHLLCKCLCTSQHSQQVLRGRLCLPLALNGEQLMLQHRFDNCRLLIGRLRSGWRLRALWGQQLQMVFRPSPGLGPLPLHPTWGSRVFSISHLKC